MSGYTINVATITGTVHKVLSLAWVVSITRIKNQPMEAVIAFPKYAYNRNDVHLFADDSGSGALHDIQILDPDGNVVFFGPAVSADATSTDGTVTLDCRGADWYLWRRYLDAQRTNELTNPSFEAGTLTGWTSGGSVTATASTAQAIRGTHSCKLVSSTALGDVYEYQTVTITGTGVGTLLTVAGYFYIDGSLTGHALDRRGLYVEGHESGVFKTNNYYALDEATPIGHWIRASTTIAIPPGATWDINVRLYSPPGTIYWDDLQVVAMQSISTASITGDITTPVDVAAIVGLVNAHVQNSAVGKSNVNIDLDNPDTGIVQVKHIQWADHIAWSDQISEWTSRDDCFDYSMVYGLSTRTMTLHSPQQGIDYRGVVTLRFPGNVTSYTVNEDGSGSITDDTELDTDTGNGPDREEGHYADATLIGGVTLQSVNSAPPKSEPSSLDPIARETVNKARRPALLYTFTIVDPLLIALLDSGDVVDFATDDGWCTASGFGRLSKLVLYPRTPKMEVTFAKATP